MTQPPVTHLELRRLRHLDRPAADPRVAPPGRLVVRRPVDHHPRVATQVLEPQRPRHAAQPEVTLPEHDLRAAHPRRPVGPHRRHHQELVGAQAPLHERRELRHLGRELRPSRHAASVPQGSDRITGVTSPRFRCPVCRQPLDVAPGGLACADGHRYDRAREGYVNLLPSAGRARTT